MTTVEHSPSERSTQLALEEKAKLVKSLGRMDMLLLSLCALVGLDTLATVSSYGEEGFLWLIVIAAAFLVPYALVMAELGSAFPQEGGPYEWMKMAWGRLPAGLGAVLYWVTNPLWVGGSLAFIATGAWSDQIHGIGAGTVGDYAFKVVFIWISITVAIVSLRYGKWIPNAGAIMRFLVLGFFSLTVVIYAIEHGVHGLSAHGFSPTKAVFIGLVPLILFNYVGFELQNGAAEEMQDAQRDVPITVIGSGILTVLCYGIPVFGIVAVLPLSHITGLSGFMDAVTQTFSVYGGAQTVLVDVMSLGFIFALVTSGAVWMIGSDRILAVAAYDGAFAGFFGRFNARLGTPVRVNVMSGIVSTAFMVAAEQFQTGSNADTFLVVLYMATSTTLLSYLLIFPTVLKLRYSHASVRRPYRVPFGVPGIWIATSLCMAWMLLGSWVAVFPDTIERWLGVGYGFVGAWGVSRMRFELFTFGTLLVILVIGIVGYVLAAPVRAREVEVPLAAPVSGSGAAPATDLA